MSNDRPEKTRQKIYEEYEDSLFKLVMHDVAQQEGRLFQEEAKKLQNDPKYQPSQEAVQNFSRQIDAYLKKSKSDTKKCRVRQGLNKAAIALLLTLLILGTTVVTVEAFRVKALNFLMDIQQEYTSFQLEDSDRSGFEDRGTTIGWHQAYVPTYIPDGYEVSTTSQNESYKKIEFTNSQGSLITYMELNAGHKPAVDTENNSVFETIDINGYKGTVVVKNSLMTVIWAMNGRMFMIQGKIDKDTAIKMARGVKYVD